ncbi:DMT family transporter [Pseudomonas donghuensis]|uniref:DMT family transporter n=1 Tax=Pseudomonas donghuensis TaxID=1163398 RepID=A0AAP0SFG3_9PSED|nr:DMT family transporter [Pseudomonas donghuensis]MDF9893342.1 drug/metabolite transporter (DMT)-like permease [Pseudomonas vranovensis]KDN99016.2 DMT family transporter [Pseudomonas donghuensis]MCP6691239.1 DMT family transporter [Pseudomonas donghuensis]MCP6695975.1 DMT family transporter [Pseudomonas donghuensis]UVL26711.1 DMT family transporter [Pseudomonas donghuensis]
MNKVMSLREWGLLIALSILWGGSFFFNGIAVKELPPFTLVMLRVGLAALVLLALVRLLGLYMPREWRIWRAFLAMGLLNNLLPFCLIVWGQARIGSGLASILNATTPLFAVIVAHLLTEDENISVNKLAGVALGFVGVAIMIGSAAWSGLDGNLWAQLAVLAAALSYAVAGVYGRRFKVMGVAPLITATGQISASAILLVPLALLIDLPWTLAAPSLTTWAAVAGLVLLSTALAYVVFFRILATAGATNLMLVTFLIPLSAIVLGVLVLGERLETRHFIGMGLIALGLAAIDGRLLKWRRVAAEDPDSFIGRDI